MSTWPGGARAAVCLTVDLDAESPHLWRTREAPPRGVAELEQRRYGPRRGVGHLLDLADRLGIAMTVFVPGWVAAHHGEAVAAVAERGHELALHGWCHEPPSALSREELLDTLGRAVDLLTAIGGARPVGYRSPSWDMTEEVFGVLRELGLGYDSSLMGDDRPYEVDGLVEVPVDWATDDAPYYRYTAGRPHPPTPAPQLREAWAAEVDAARRWGTLCMLTVHPWLSGRPARVGALEALLAPVVSDPQLATPTVATLAEHHRRTDGDGHRVAVRDLGRPDDV